MDAYYRQRNFATGLSHKQATSISGLRCLHVIELILDNVSKQQDNYNWKCCQSEITNSIANQEIPAVVQKCLAKFAFAG